MLTSWKENYDQPRQHIKKQRHYFANKGLSRQGYGFSSSHVWIWELDCEESWALKNWCFWTVVLEKTLESPLDCKEIQPAHPRGDQSWVFIGRTDVEAETPILWPPDAKETKKGRNRERKKVRVTQSRLTLCDPMDCSLPVSSIHGIFQARVLEWVAISFSRRSSQLRDRTQVSCIAGRHFTIWATREAQKLTHLKRPWCWERLKSGGEGDNRGWDDWMALLTRWARVWVNSRSWWWTDVLRFMGSQRVGHSWVTELNWTTGELHYFQEASGKQMKNILYPGRMIMSRGDNDH